MQLKITVLEPQHCLRILWTRRLTIQFQNISSIDVIETFVSKKKLLKKSDEQSQVSVISTSKVEYTVTGTEFICSEKFEVIVICSKNIYSMYFTNVTNHVGEH